MATFLLIPGAGGSAWDFHRLVPVLAERGHTAIAVDLPATDPQAGLAEYADAALAALGEHRDDPELVVLGESLGGFTAPLVAAKVRAALIVLLNPMVPAPGETAGALVGQHRLGAGPRRQGDADGRDPEFDVVRDFFHDVPAEITEQALANPQSQSDGPFGDPWPLPRGRTCRPRSSRAATTGSFPWNSSAASSANASA